MIIGMGEAGPVFLGVQRDEVQQVSMAKCKIKGGKVGETFDIVRETEHLVVIKGEQGFMFTGDFKHAGVRHSSDDELLEDLNKRVSAIVDDEALSDKKRMNLVMDIICNFKGLNRLCRLHCATRLIKRNVELQHNTIGFTGCWKNTPRGEREVLHSDTVMSVMSINDHDDIAKDTELWFPKGKTFEDSHQLFEMVKLFATKWHFRVKRDGVKIMCHLWPSEKGKRKEGKCPWTIGFYQDRIKKKHIVSSSS
jgi:hypothetical protein